MAKKTPKAIRTKKETVLRLLKRSQGASIAEIEKATGWQSHTVRSFLSAKVGKKLGLKVTSQKNKSGVRRYRIEKEEA